MDNTVNFLYLFFIVVMVNGMFIKMEEVTNYYVAGSTSVRALYNVNINIKKGEFVCIAGPSGSGKTTLLNLLGGLDSPTEGRIYVDGREITAMSDSELSAYRRDQRFYLLPHFTVLENVIFPLRFRGIAHKSDRYPAELSGGKQQRVAIARRAERVINLLDGEVRGG